MGVFLAYASRFGQALIDRRLYLPASWAGNGERRAKARVPEDVAFATKPQIACDLIARALDAGMPCAWVLADALYGSDSRLRRMLEDRGQPCVLAVRSNHHLRFLTDHGLVETDPATLADGLEAEAWTAHAAGEGAKGLWLYDWARIALPWTTADGFERWLLIRRSTVVLADQRYAFGSQHHPRLHCRVFLPGPPCSAAWRRRSRSRGCEVHVIRVYRSLATYDRTIVVQQIGWPRDLLSKERKPT